MYLWIPWELVADPLGSGGTLRESLDYEYSIWNESTRNAGYGCLYCDCFCLHQCFLVFENLLIKYFRRIFAKSGCCETVCGFLTMLSVYLTMAPVVGWSIKVKLHSIWKEAIVALSRIYPDIFLEGLRETTKRNRGIRFFHRDSYCVPP